jgi:hypothetical protein
MIRKDLIDAVREMLERHWDSAAIASKIGIDHTTVLQIIDIINGLT